MDGCFFCFYGGNCFYGIVVRLNFWGYCMLKNLLIVVFNICFFEYCGLDIVFELILSYNSCCGYRSGIFCGCCCEGYMEVMFFIEC